MLSSIPDLYPLEAAGVFPIPTNSKNQKCLRLDSARVENHEAGPFRGRTSVSCFYEEHGQRSEVSPCPGQHLSSAFWFSFQLCPQTASLCIGPVAIHSFTHSLISSMTLECLLCTRRHKNKQAKTPALREIIPVNREHGVGVIAHVPGLIRFFLITAAVILIL